ncbi:hypothetical protein C8J55DRAFT_490740 [Lentinula edodes]|uniref:Uncharacterized protein n=1 Tax=Lentinula lateritia TaxID=40482 RepID=A0A9W9A5J7_9AGAR|nr:hypothetical protein C8J55DRAFT_490740 [Lentinula edodes]
MNIRRAMDGYTFRSLKFEELSFKGCIGTDDISMAVRFFSEETLCIQVDSSLFPHIVVLLQPLAGSAPSLGESSTTLPVLKGVIHSASWEVLDNSLARSALRARHHLRELTLTHQAGFTAQELTVLDDPVPCIAVLNVAGSYGPQSCTGVSILLLTISCFSAVTTYPSAVGELSLEAHMVL